MRLSRSVQTSSKIFKNLIFSNKYNADTEEFEVDVDTKFTLSQPGDGDVVNYLAR